MIDPRNANFEHYMPPETNFCGDYGIDSRLYEIIDELKLIDSVPDKLIQKLRDIQDDIPCDCEDRI
jgi:hypothetical protein